MRLTLCCHQLNRLSPIDYANGLFFYYKEHSDGEERFRFLAQIANKIIIIFVFKDSEVIRIISVRVATKKEKKTYAEYSR